MKIKSSYFLVMSFIMIFMASSALCEPPPPLIEDPGPLIEVQPQILIGYMFPTRASNLTISIPGHSSIRRVEQYSKIDGVWAELVIPVKSAYPIGFTGSFGYLIPGSYQPHEVYHQKVNGIAERTWNTSTTYFNLRLSIEYNFINSFYGILGFHYDSFMANFLNPEKMVPNGLNFNSSQMAHINVTGGSPFGGVMYDRTFGAGANVKAYAIGYPGLPCVISYQESVDPATDDKHFLKFDRETSSGYFFEGFAQVTVPVWRGLSGGAFAKYDEYSAKVEGTEVNFKRSSDANSSTSSSSTSADVTYLRNTWIFGGVITMSF